jgi:polygalacturonase
MFCRSKVGLLGLVFALAGRFLASADPALPVIPNQTFVITNPTYGAVGDGITTNTTSIQNAINAASTAGGGTVEFPAGTYLCGPLTMKSSINLQLDSGALLRMLPYDKYPGGIVNPANFINGSSLHDIEISGTGAIDGQGSPWWPGYKTNNRPVMVSFSACTRVWIRDATFSNSPAAHLVVKGRAGNVTIEGVNIIAPSSSDPTNPSHNTDAIDLAETNAVIRNCNITVGDDNVAVGSSASASADIVITNCVFGDGHGLSVGSFTSGGVSNMTVINCTFNRTDNGIRIKSDNDRGGIVQNLSYLNIGMTNVHFPITIYSYYNSVGTPSSITPAVAASQTVIPYPTNNPVYRNITFSNIFATAISGFPAGIIWARPEMPATNITFYRCNLSASKSFDVYSARGVRFVDPQINVPSTVTSFLLYNSQVIVTNSTPGANLTIDGLAANSTVNALTLVNAQASLKNTNVFDGGPLSLSASTLTVSNNLNLSASAQVNFTLGTNAATITVRSNLALGATINLTGGPGFTNGLYTLFTYGSGLNWASPALGATPAGNYTYSLNTNFPGQVRLSVQPGVSLTPVSLNFEATANQLALSWPADHIGWRLLVQTNSTAGLSTNWQIVAGSDTTNQMFVPVDPAQGSVFLRLTYP